MTEKFSCHWQKVHFGPVCEEREAEYKKRLLNKWRCLFKLSVEKYCLKYSNKIQQNIFNSFSTLSVQLNS